MNHKVDDKNAMKRTQVVILAGGLGTRLRPITETIPKPLVPVFDKPFLFWQLLDLKAQGFTRILLLVAYLGQQIVDYFGDGSSLGLEIEYSFEPSPMGTGGALKNAQDLLDDEFILINGDSFLQAPLVEMVKEFRDQNLEALISTYDNRVPTPVIPNLITSEGLVRNYKKDAGLAEGFDLIDSGVYVIKKKVIERTQADHFALADLWPDLVKQQKLGAFAVNERFYDIGTPERLKEFEEKVRDHLAHTLSN